MALTWPELPNGNKWVYATERPHYLVVIEIVNSAGYRMESLSYTQNDALVSTDTEQDLQKLIDEVYLMFMSREQREQEELRQAGIRRANLETAMTVIEENKPE